jgi:hypothetical protein
MYHSSAKIKNMWNFPSMPLIYYHCMVLVHWDTLTL